MVSGANSGAQFPLRFLAQAQAKKVNTDWVALLKSSGKEPADALAEARAAQILAEMLGTVCHPEYFRDPAREQTVYNHSTLSFSHRILQGIVVHFDGFYVSIYFAIFPSEYLETVRIIDIEMFKHRERKVQLNHTRRYNLFNTADWTELSRSLLRFSVLLLLVRQTSGICVKITSSYIEK